MADSKDNSSAIRIAIVGGGPRGLSVVEALAKHGGDMPVRAVLFERSKSPGAGPNYEPSQTPLNLLNVPLRDIDIGAVPHIVSFSEWCARQALGFSEDSFPPRASVGVYLCERLSAARRFLPDRFDLRLVAQEAVSCRKNAEGWRVGLADEDEDGPFDEVVLCVGHQPVKDEQVENWRRHAEKTGRVLADAYPSEALLERTDWRDKTVAIRGFGLAMIDVSRVLTEGLGGRFDTASPGERRLVYRASGCEPAKLVPFSLDGMPPAPKPASRAVDESFVIEGEDRAALREAVAQVLRSGDGDLGPLRAALARVVGDRGVGESDVRRWLEDGAKEDPGVPDDERPAEAMARYLAMAHGEIPPSVGYATGQVWRHLQNDLRVAYDPHPKTAACAEALAGFDEGLKRFSYGPPAAAIARLLALIEAERLTLRRVDDPDVACVAGGWRVAENGGTDVASALVDSVLASPALDSASAPLLVDLREEGLLAPMAEKLGALVSPSAQVLDRKGRPVEGLSVLGRVASGAVIASDSLHDCFGEGVSRWAARVLDG